MGVKKINGNLNIVGGNLNIVGGNLLLDGQPLSMANYDGIRFEFNENTNYTLDDESGFASYIRLSGQVLFLVASFYITKDTLGTGSNPITIGKFKNIPNEIWGKLVADSNGYLDEQDTQAFVDGTFTSVGSKTALVKNTTNQTLDLVLETTNLVNDQEYHIRYSVTMLLTNNIALNPVCIISNLGNQDPTNVMFVKGKGFPRTEQDIYEEVTINGNVFIKFKTWYKKPVFNGDELIGYQISNEKIDDTFVPYDCFVDENGNVLPYILIGKYPISSTSIANSVYYQNGGVNQTLANARTNAKALGTGYQLFDCAMYCFLRDIVFAYGESFFVTLGEHYSCMGLNNMNGLGYALDGIVQTGGNKYLYSNKPSKYVDNPTTTTEGYFVLSYPMPTNTSQQTITKLGYDASHPTISLPSEVSSTNDNSTYYRSAFYSTRGKVNFNGAFGASGSRGLFWSGCRKNSTDTVWARLCYRPIS